MRVEEVLSEGVSTARDRIHLVFLDVAWKAVWLVVTLIFLLSVVVWFASDLRTIAWQDTGIRNLNDQLARRLLREFWNVHRDDIIRSVAAVFIFSAAFWFWLEAYFRARILRKPDPRLSRKERVLFLASSLLKTMLLAGAGATLVLITFSQILLAPTAEWPALWPDARGPAAASLIAILALAFLLTVLDTLVRGDAVQLLGTDLIRVTGLIGILLSVEIMVGGFLGAIVITGFLHVSRMPEAVAMGVAALIAIGFLTFLHSYLLLVRFSAVDIMRHNVVEI